MVLYDEKLRENRREQKMARLRLYSTGWAINITEWRKGKLLAVDVGGGPLPYISRNIHKKRPPKKGEKNILYGYIKIGANQVTYCHRKNGTDTKHIQEKERARDSEREKKCIYIDRTDYSDPIVVVPIMPVLCIHVCVYVWGERDAELLHHLHNTNPQISGPFSLFLFRLCTTQRKEGAVLLSGAAGGLRPGAGWWRIHTHKGRANKKIPRTVSCFTVDWKGNKKIIKSLLNWWEIERKWNQFDWVPSGGPSPISPLMIRPTSGSNHLPSALAITKFDQVNRW